MIDEIDLEAPIKANMDDLDDQENSAGLDEQLYLLEEEYAIKTLMDAIVKRLQEETCQEEQTGAINYWLNSYLKCCDFLIRAVQCHGLCQKLCICETSKVCYFKDIKIWIP